MRTVLAALAVTIALIGQTPAAAAQQADTLAVVNVHVITMEDESVIDDGVVVVSGDRIVDVGPAGEVVVPGDAVTIDGAGGYLIPGLVDAHSHLLDNEDALTLSLANGVTTIRDPNADYVGTGSTILGWRDEIAAGQRLGPTIFAAKSLGALPPQFSGVYDNIDAVTAPWLTIDPAALELAADPDSARELVRAAHEQGYDIIKVNWFLNRDTFDAIVAAAAEVGMPILAHVPADVGVEHSIRSGVEIQHNPNLLAAVAKDYERRPGANYLDIFDLSEADGRLPDLVTLMADEGVSFTPTMSTDKAAFDIFANLSDLANAPIFERPEYGYVKPATLAEWKDPAAGELGVVLRDAGASSIEEILPPIEQREAMWSFYQRQLRALVDAGVPVLVGSDSSALGVVWGFAEHDELELFVDAGLSPYEALSAATRIPAEVMDPSGDWGTISAGRRADLVLLSANPLDDITNTRQIEGVMARGRWFTKADLQGALDDIAARYEALAAGAVTLEPVSTELFSGLAPAGWNPLGPGALARGNPDVDPTVFIQIVAPDTPPDALALQVVERYGVTDLGPPRDTFQSESLTWSIRLIEHDVGILGVALAEQDGVSYLVMVVAQPDEADLLANTLFFPAVSAL
ncbi:MAG: amidohydrolase family protein, partial [Acidimicrobiia bacterium]|nr:amidohydrolase family protein [Acidimicrobiia bacterium]